MQGRLGDRSLYGNRLPGPLFIGKALLDNPLLKAMVSKFVYVDPTSWYVASGGLTATKAMIEDIRSALL